MVGNFIRRRLLKCLTANLKATTNGGRSGLHLWIAKKIKVELKFVCGCLNFFTSILLNFSAAAKQYERAYKLACAVPIDDQSHERENFNTLTLSCLNNLSNANFKLNDYRCCKIRNEFSFFA